MKRQAMAPVLSPFVVRIDTREQWPWTFDGICAGADLDHALIDVRSVVGTIASGDYSIDGMQDRVALERKSLEDLYSTLTHGRQRFVRELERLAELDMAAVVVEAGWHAIAHEPPPRSRANPRSIVASILAFQQRYPTVAWITAGSRRLAEGLAYRSLERFWIDFHEGNRPGRLQSAGAELAGSAGRQHGVPS